MHCGPRQRALQSADPYFPTAHARSAEELSHSSGTWVALQSFWRLPGIYVAMFLVRGLCIAAFMPFFTFIGSGDPVLQLLRGHNQEHKKGWTPAQPVCDADIVLTAAAAEAN